MASMIVFSPWTFPSLLKHSSQFIKPKVHWRLLSFGHFTFILLKINSLKDSIKVILMNSHNTCTRNIPSYANLTNFHSERSARYNLNLTQIFFQQRCTWWYHWASEGFRGTAQSPLTESWHFWDGCWSITTSSCPTLQRFSQCSSSAWSPFILSLLFIKESKWSDWRVWGHREKSLPRISVPLRINSTNGCWSAQAHHPHQWAQEQVSVIFLNCCKSKNGVDKDTKSFGGVGLRKNGSIGKLLQRAMLQPVKTQPVARAFCIYTN